MYRSVSSSIRLPVSVLTTECRDILDQFWPLKLQNKDSGMELVQGRMWIKVVCLQNNTLLLNPTTHLGGDNVKQSFLSTETTQWQCIAHLYTWEERERQLKCFEVTCPLMDRHTNMPIYTPTSPWRKVSGFVIKYKALMIIHPHLRKPCMAGIAFKQNSISYEGILPSVTAFTSVCVTAGWSQRRPKRWIAVSPAGGKRDDLSKTSYVVFHFCFLFLLG